MYKKLQVAMILVVFAIIPIIYFNSFPNYKQTKLCYIRNTEDGGKAKMIIVVSGVNVNGQFDWKPTKQIPKSGLFSGKIYQVNNITKNMYVQAKWSFLYHGVVRKEELRMIVGLSTVSPAFGEMKLSNTGVYVYSQPEQIKYGPNLQLVDCNQL